MTPLLISVYFLLIDHGELDPGAREAVPLPAETEERLSCDRSIPLEVELKIATDAGGLRVIRGETSFRRSQTEELRRVTFDYYRADGGTADSGGDARPVVVVSPITGGNYEVARLIASDLLAQGYHAVIVRRPEDGKALRAQEDLRTFESEMRNAIVARRRVIDWLVARPEVDPRRIGAYGVSLGGVLTAALAAVDDRIVASILVMASGDLPELLGRSVEPEPRRLAQANGVPPDPAPKDLEAFADLARPILLTDPVLLAKHVDPRKIFQVITRRDTSVPTDLQRRLHEALGGPESLSLPTGHYSIASYLPFTMASARNFLARRFASVEE